MDQLNDYWLQLSQWQPTHMTIYAIIIVAILAAVLSSRVTGGLGFVTVPVGFVVMYLCAYVANFSAQPYVVPGVDEFQRAIMFSACGAFVGGILMLLIFKVKEQQNGGP
jgi:hypothetical protein